MKKTIAFLFALWLIPCYNILLAQHQNDTWYLGLHAGFKFTPTGPVFITDNDKGGPTTCISDPATGDLLFHTSGFYVWGKDNNYMKGGDGILTNTVGNYTYGCVIVPVPGSPKKYYVISPYYNNLYYAIVDMAANGGKGEVVVKEQVIQGFSSNGSIDIVRHSYLDAYWMIIYTNDMYFHARLITDKGFGPPVVSGPLGLVPTGPIHGMVSSPNGKKVCISYSFYDTATNATGAFMVFDFDKTCGTFSNPVLLKRDHPHWHSTYGMCFSPDSKKLYVNYHNSMSGTQQSSLDIIVQYHDKDFSKNDTVIQVNGSRFLDMEAGPDNRIYINTRVNPAQPLQIDKIEYPNNSADKCGFKLGAFLSANNNGLPYGFKFFIRDRTQPGPNADNPGIIADVQGICPGDSTRFTILPPFMPDSVAWDFGDKQSNDNTSTAFNPSHLYTDTGTFAVNVIWKKCGVEVKQVIMVTIQDFSYLNLGPDTTFCHNDSFTFTSNITGAKHTWNTGSNATAINVKKGGKYWLTVESGLCKATDTVEIKELAPILIDIGDEYTICDDGTELVQLDAGKGYKHYLWTPTGDTTQWIIVKAAGEHFVVVEDYRGCKGDDGAKVLRQCDFTFYIPNSFTPNGDGKNDVFGPVFTDVTDYNIEIYNLWGELIYRSNDPAKGWDGMYKGSPAPIGAYVWQLRFKGFNNRLLRNYNHNGVVSLLR